MPKQKTHKGTAKRFKRTGTGKLSRRTSGHDHFNARERSTERRNKRRASTVHETDAPRLNKLVPYL